MCCPVCLQGCVTLYRGMELYRWTWLCVVAAPRALWRDKVELYINGVLSSQENVKYPVIKKVTEAFIGGCVVWLELCFKSSQREC